MAQELTVEGKQYISSKRAAEVSGYAQDYIGQLARKQLIDARRIGGLWYVYLDSLMSYQKKAEEYKPQPPVFRPEMNAAPDTVVSFDGKDYVSAARAAALTGYHQDYVGQLARSGTILSKQIGNRWYVDRDALLEHKKSKDALLAAVQAESVGVTKQEEHVPARQPASDEEAYTYFSESGDLLPKTPEKVPARSVESPIPQEWHAPEAFSASQDAPEERVVTEEYTPVPIRRIAMPEPPVTFDSHAQTRRLPTQRSRGPVYAVAGAMATIVIVLTIGFTTVKGSATYTQATDRLRNTAASLEAKGGVQRIADFIEQHFIPPLQYVRN